MATANKNTFFRQKKLSMVAVDGRSKNHRGEKGRWLKKEEHEKVTEMVFSQPNLYLFAELNLFFTEEDNIEIICVYFSGGKTGVCPYWKTEGSAQG